VPTVATQAPPPTPLPTSVQATSLGDEPLGWSSDGTRLLIVRDGQLIVLHGDGSETQLTTGVVGINDAWITPDGSHVVFAGGIGQYSAGQEGECCEQYGLFTVDADGGPLEILVEPGDSQLEETALSPDGTRLAYVQGGGDHGHRVWMVNIDGTEAHEVVANDVTLGAGHVGGIAWSPAGDRLALLLEGFIWTFAPDGSGFTHGSSVSEFCFPGHPEADCGSSHHTVAPVPSPTNTAASAGEVTALVSNFLDARVAGEGAEEYLNAPTDDLPLLYAASTGASYERTEFEPVLGYEWPYSLTAFKVRLFAGDTVVEQLVFKSLEDDRLALEYVSDGFGTDIAPTTEDGRPIAVPYEAFDGQATLNVAHPWVYRYARTTIQLIPDDPGLQPTTDIDISFCIIEIIIS